MQAIRRKATKETQDIKEDLKKKEQLKEAAAKRREKQEELAAKERIRAKIKADQEARRLKSEREKAEREGRAAPEPAAAEASKTPAAPPSTPTSKPASAYTETRLRLQMTSGTVQKSFPVDTTLQEVAAVLLSEGADDIQTFTQNFPKKIFRRETDFDQTLKEAGLVPSAALIVK